MNFIIFITRDYSIQWLRVFLLIVFVCALSSQQYDGRFLVFDRRHGKVKQSTNASTVTTNSDDDADAVGANANDARGKHRGDTLRQRLNEIDARLTETVRQFLNERGEYDRFDDVQRAIASVDSNALKNYGNRAASQKSPGESPHGSDNKTSANFIKNSSITHSSVASSAPAVSSAAEDNSFIVNNFEQIGERNDVSISEAHPKSDQARRNVAETRNKSKETAKELYAVVRVIPEIGAQIKYLERLERDDAADLRLNFWTSPVRVGSAVDVMVPYGKLPQFKKMMQQNDMQPDVIIEDVERLIIEREEKLKKPYALRFHDEVRIDLDANASDGNETTHSEKNRRSLPSLLVADGAASLSSATEIMEKLADENNWQRVTNAGDFRRTSNANGGSSGGGSALNDAYDFHRYGSYTQMVAWMRSLAHRHPNFVQFISIGKTHEGRSIDGLEIGTRGLRKRAFWIDGGIHAREWAAPHTALYFIHQLTSRYGRDTNMTRLVSELTWIIIPLLNPDGYEYTRLSTNPNVRLWRKNRAPTHCVVDQWGRNRCCKGVDLNRNFDFHFKESGSSDDPCSEIYQGKGPFSEPEARAVRDAILSSRYRSRVDGFITLHTYSQIWIHPYGHKKDSYPGDVQDLYSVGKQATVALSKLYGTKYILGSGADTLYPASGGSEDWAKESAAIKFVYLLELRPDERSWDGFILDETQLIPTASETWAGVKVVAEAIIQRARNRVQPQQRISGIRQHRFGNGTPGSCYDLRHACKRWIQESETLCKSVPVFMREQCAYSCGFC